MKIQPIVDYHDGPITGYAFWCPGCKEHHSYRTQVLSQAVADEHPHLLNRDGTFPPTWEFDSNLEFPTFSPSLLYATKQPRCHLFVQAGKIIYCSDCDHELAGQTVEMKELDR